MSSSGVKDYDGRLRCCEDMSLKLKPKCRGCSQRPRPALRDPILRMLRKEMFSDEAWKKAREMLAERGWHA